MALLTNRGLAAVVGASLALVGCYSPDLSDCAVVCAANDDCAGNQSCVGGWCTAGATCNGLPDGGAATTDGNQRMITLRVEVMGEGKVVIPGVGECNKSGPTGPMCVYEVPVGELTLTAMINRPDKPFERWTSFKCGGQGAACTDVFVADAMVTAKFK